MMRFILSSGFSMRRLVASLSAVAVACVHAACGDADPSGPTPSESCIAGLELAGAGFASLQRDDLAAIDFGAAGSGLLATSDVEDDGYFYDIWVFDLAQDDGVRIDLESGEFDPVLILLDADWQLVVVDDDSGADKNSLVTTPLPGGCHVVLVTSFEPGETGSYTLRVRAD